MVGPAAAVTVSSTDTPDEVRAGERITAEFTLEELYQNPQTGEWTLNGTTELEDATWTVTFFDQQGTQVATRDVGGQNVSVPGVNPDNVAEVRVQVTGTVPEPDSYSYPENETFLVAELEQVRQGGTLNTIDSWEAVHFTEESREARQAIAAAGDAIEAAEAAGASVESEQDLLESAKSVYRDGNFEEAVNLAEQARNQAESARKQAESAQSRNQLLLYGGVGVVALLVLAGGLYWYRSTRQTHDKLG
ncbi:MAG: DUF4398 domain-containing protein [Halobacteriaceae archaeon]